MDLLDVIIAIIKIVYNVLTYSLAVYKGFNIYVIYLVIGVIIVYKIRFYDYRTEGEQPERVLESKGSMKNAEYRTKKKILNESPNSDLQLNTMKTKKGGFWRIVVRGLFYSDVYVPMEDDDSYLTEKQKRSTNEYT